MPSKSKVRKFVTLGIIFSIMAILFALLHYFNVISHFDAFLVVIYILYFVGIALFYNGAYNREHDRSKSTVSCYIIGAICLLGSIGMLTYGLITGIVILF